MPITVFGFQPSDLPSSRSILSVPDVTYRETLRVPLNQIDVNIGNYAQNSVRGGNEDGAHIAEIQSSLKQGVDINQAPPSLEFLDKAFQVDGVVKRFRPLDGHHRIKALQNLGASEYVFDIYGVKSMKGRILFQLQKNNHLPAKRSLDVDIEKSFCDLIKSGEFLDSNGNLDTPVLESELQNVGGFRIGAQRLKTLISKIENRSGKLSNIKEYPDKDAEKWISQYMPNVKLDRGRKNPKHNWWIMRTGNYQRTFVRMLRAYRAKGSTQTQYIILNPRIAPGGDVATTRRKFVTDIHELWDTLCNVTGGSKTASCRDRVFKVVYALPQIVQTEDFTLPVDLTKTNKLVAI